MNLSSKEAKEHIARIDALIKQIDEKTYTGDKDKLIKNLAGFARNMLIPFTKTR